MFPGVLVRFCWNLSVESTQTEICHWKLRVRCVSLHLKVSYFSSNPEIETVHTAQLYGLARSKWSMTSTFSGNAVERHSVKTGSISKYRCHANFNQQFFEKLVVRIFFCSFQYILIEKRGALWTQSQHLKTTQTSRFQIPISVWIAPNESPYSLKLVYKISNAL